MRSPGTFGHGGAWGTQAWIDPARGFAYILTIQRSDIGNSDASEIRRRVSTSRRRGAQVPLRRHGTCAEFAAVLSATGPFD
jgi:CubicO group peptidase (beta-lactamase class C family)